MYDKMPKHIQSLSERSIINFYHDQAIALDQALIESEGSFAKDGSDTSCICGGIVHNIDTKDAKPTKARMHLIPISFQAEEEKHLENPFAVSTHIYLYNLTFSSRPDEAASVWRLQKLVCNCKGIELLLYEVPGRVHNAWFCRFSLEVNSGSPSVVE